MVLSVGYKGVPVRAVSRGDAWSETSQLAELYPSTLFTSEQFFDILYLFYKHCHLNASMKLKKVRESLTNKGCTVCLI